MHKLLYPLRSQGKHIYLGKHDIERSSAGWSMST